jgi:hypothetical protein
MTRFSAGPLRQGHTGYRETPALYQGPTSVVPQNI